MCAPAQNDSSLADGVVGEHAPTMKRFDSAWPQPVIQEFGHYLGMSEEEIEAIEEQFWRREPADDVYMNSDCPN